MKAPFLRLALGVATLFSPVVALAQGEPAAADSAEGGFWSNVWNQLLSEGTLTILKNLGLAVGILFIGWLLARLLSYVLYAVLCKTEIDNKIAKMLRLDLLIKSNGKESENAVERFISRAFFYLLMLFVIVAALWATGLQGAASPISSLLDTLIQALPQIGKAILILVVAYCAGFILRKLTTAALKRGDEKFAELGGSAENKEAKPFSEKAGALVFWLIMLIGLAGAFEALKIEAISTPIQGAFSTAMDFLPKVGAAALILLGGYILGRIARYIVANVLQSVGFNRLMERIHLGGLFTKHKASDVIGVIVMIFIGLHALIAALDALSLKNLSDPISNTIAQFWAILPSLCLAVLILVLGVFLGKIARTIISNVLSAIGFDRWMSALGLDLGRLHKDSAEKAAPAANTEGETAVFAAIPENLSQLSEKPVEEKSEENDKKCCCCRIEKMSDLIGMIGQLAIVLLALVQSLDTVGLEVWAGMVQTFLSYTFLRLLVALLIVGIGIAIGNYVRALIIAKGAPDDSSRPWIGGAVRIAILVFACTMAVQQLDVAPSFVLLTFALVFGAFCLALALAFGLGARETAGDIVKQQYTKARDKSRKGFFGR